MIVTRDEAIIICYLAKYGKNSLIVDPEKIAVLLGRKKSIISPAIQNMRHDLGLSSSLEHSPKIYADIAAEYKDMPREEHKKIVIDIIKKLNDRSIR